MAKDFTSIFVGFALVGLFVFAMISFGYTLQSDNGVEDTILENSILNRTYNSLNTNLSTFRSVAQNQSDAFQEEIPTSGFGSLLLFSVVSGGKVFQGLIVSVFNILIVLPASFLGINPIVFSVLSAILLITIILSLWRLYKLGG